MLSGFLLVAAYGCRQDVDPSTSLATEPDVGAAVSAPLKFRQISASNGGLSTCGVTTDDLGYCWGANNFGNLGDGTFQTRLIPAAVVGGLRFKEVREGVTHTCGLTTDGRAYCWGENNNGQLGNGTDGAPSLTPVAVAGGRRFTQIRVGFRHSCALTAAGVAFCWGDNGVGQLGTGTTTGPEDCAGLSCSTRPVRVPGSFVWTEIRPGGEHTCGLTNTQRAYCWGNNGFGQVGDGSIDNRSKPVAVAGNHLFKQVSAGGVHTCAVATDDRAFCWGRNRDGRVGGGSTTPRRRKPVAVTGGLKFSGVTAGTEHTCGVTTGNVAYCWGLNIYSQLGDGTQVNRSVPTRVAGGLRWDVVLAGWRHSCGIVVSTGAAYCWGENGAGQLGNGTTVNHPTPIAVVGP